MVRRKFDTPQIYNILQKNMQPVYDFAIRQGYEIWNYQGGVTIAVIFDKDLTFRQKIAECGRDAFCKRLI